MCMRPGFHLHICINDYWVTLKSFLQHVFISLTSVFETVKTPEKAAGRLVLRSHVPLIYWLCTNCVVTAAEFIFFAAVQDSVLYSCLMFQCEIWAHWFLRRSVLHKGLSVSWRREAPLLRPASDASSPSPTYELSQHGKKKKKNIFNQVASNGCLSRRLKNNPIV